MTWPGSSFYLSSIKPEGDFSYQFIVQKKGGCSPREALTELDKKIEEEESSFDCTLGTVVEELHNIHGLMKQMTEMAKGNDYYIFIIFSLQSPLNFPSGSGLNRLTCKINVFAENVLYFSKDLEAET